MGSQVNDMTSKIVLENFHFQKTTSALVMSLKKVVTAPWTLQKVSTLPLVKPFQSYTLPKAQ